MQINADSRLYVIATSMLFTGYMGIKLFYDGVFKLSTGAAHKSSFAFFVLILFAFLTGAGGSAVRLRRSVTRRWFTELIIQGITGSVNAVARSFSDARVCWLYMHMSSTTLCDRLCFRHRHGQYLVYGSRDLLQLVL